MMNVLHIPVSATAIIELMDTIVLVMRGISWLMGLTVLVRIHTVDCRKKLTFRNFNYTVVA